MSTASGSTFTPPPVVECISQQQCLGFGKKVHRLNKICANCLRRHDPQQLREWAGENSEALSLIANEVARKQETKQNLEAHGRYLCAFEDPDYEHCRWRRSDLNLRGTRTDCGVAKRKGAACEKCWRRHLLKIGVVQYFTPLGLCHEEADKTAEESQGAAEVTEEDDDDGVMDDDTNV